ncbi:MAG: methyl-accepting chemotaxis protein [Veillonellales bacterium]
MSNGFNSIRVRIMLAGGVLLILALGILSGASYYYASRCLTKSVDETAQSVAADYADRVQTQVGTVMIQLEDLAATPGMKKVEDQNGLKQRMGDALQRIGKLDQMTFIYPDGFSIRPNGSTAQLAEREYFKKVISTKQNYVSEILVSVTTGKASAILCVPILDNGELKGVLTGTYSLEQMNDLVKDVKIKDTGHGFLLDEKGMVIAHGVKPEFVGKLSLTQKTLDPALKLGNMELNDRLLSLSKASVEDGQKVRGTYTFIDGVTNIATFTPIDLAGGKHWTLVVTAPEAEATQEINNLKWMMFVIAAVCVILSLVIVMYLSGRFAKPIVSMRNQVVRVAAGDLQVEKLDSDSRDDELGELAKSFNSMVDNLRDLVKQVQSQSQHVAASSEELNASAEQSAQATNQIAAAVTDIARGTDRQVTAVDEASAVIEQMSAGIQQVATSANSVAGVAEKAADAAQAGGKSAAAAVSQMSSIEKTVGNSAQVVAKLGERSKEIGEIVAAISGIAGQTNLLALNAAIEAARAGEQGRGFAVVAEEVRKLAEQSQEAASKIADLIGEIQGDTERAVAAMGDGTREVKVGTEVVSQAGEAFNEIMTIVNQVSSQVKEISAAIQQLTEGSQQIVSSVKAVDKISKDNGGQTQTVSAAAEEQSASMEEIASASQGLARMAQDLQSVISKFKV